MVSAPHKYWRQTPRHSHIKWKSPGMTKFSIMWCWTMYTVHLSTTIPGDSCTQFSFDSGLVSVKRSRFAPLTFLQVSWSPTTACYTFVAWTKFVCLFISCDCICLPHTGRPICQFVFEMPLIYIHCYPFCFGQHLEFRVELQMFSSADSSVLSWGRRLPNLPVIWILMSEVSWYRQQPFQSTWCHHQMWA